MSISKLWVESHRPKSIEDIVFQDDHQRQQFMNMVAAQEIPNLLLSGIQGTGKTTVSRALIRDLDIDRGDVLMINASDETGVDAMRDKIGGFAQSMSFGKFKVVQLEEADYLSPNAQAILRKIIEDYSSVTRFIITCNYANKIIPALKSRVQEFHFKAPEIEAVTVLMAEILDAEKVEFDLDVLEKFISVAYPDIRKIINLLEQNSKTGTLIAPKTAGSSEGDYKFKLLDLITANDFRQARKLVCENAQREDYEDLYRFLYENIHKSPKFNTPDKEEAAIVVIASYLYKHALSSDVEINAAAMFIELGGL
jgi:replication factor C small subunit